jgi:hypothetical protein
MEATCLREIYGMGGKIRVKWIDDDEDCESAEMNGW